MAQFINRNNIINLIKSKEKDRIISEKDKLIAESTKK